MKYNKEERQAIKSLSDSARGVFEIIEREEKGEMVGIPNLCHALEQDPRFVLFSCLSGDGQREELGIDLGTLFTTRLGKRVEGFKRLFCSCGKEPEFTVFVDDTEPVRVWQWRMPQEEVTNWYQMVAEDHILPFGCEVMLWSAVEKKLCPDDSSEEKINPLFLHQLLSHMQKFPNKKLKPSIDLRDVAVRRLLHYERQGRVLRQVMPYTILIQTETPWSVKDPLYNPQENLLSIVHPFEERR
jgi:hypothetical protein